MVQHRWSQYTRNTSQFCGLCFALPENRIRVRNPPTDLSVGSKLRLSGNVPALTAIDTVC